MLTATKSTSLPRRQISDLEQKRIKESKPHKHVPHNPKDGDDSQLVPGFNPNAWHSVVTNQEMRRLLAQCKSTEENSRLQKAVYQAACGRVLQNVLHERAKFHMHFKASNGDEFMLIELDKNLDIVDSKQMGKDKNGKHTVNWQSEGKEKLLDMKTKSHVDIIQKILDKKLVHARQMVVQNFKHGVRVVNAIYEQGTERIHEIKIGTASQSIFREFFIVGNPQATMVKQYNSVYPDRLFTVATLTKGVDPKWQIYFSQHGNIHNPKTIVNDMRAYDDELMAMKAAAAAPWLKDAQFHDWEFLYDCLNPSQIVKMWSLFGVDHGDRYSFILVESFCPVGENTQQGRPDIQTRYIPNIPPPENYTQHQHNEHVVNSQRYTPMQEHMQAMDDTDKMIFKQHLKQQFPTTKISTITPQQSRANKKAKEAFENFDAPITKPVVQVSTCSTLGASNHSMSYDTYRPIMMVE